MDKKLNMMIVSDEVTITSQLKTVAEMKTDRVVCVKAKEAIREMNRDMADIILFVQAELELSVEVVQMLKMINPNALVLFVAHESDFSLLRTITRAGADEFYVFPEEASLFSSRFPNIVNSYAMKKGGGRRIGRVYIWTRSWKNHFVL